jgi:hypothetical protein
MKCEDWIEQELLKPDLVSKILLTVTGLLLFLPLLVLLVALFVRVSS